MAGLSFLKPCGQSPGQSENHSFRNVSTSLLLSEKTGCRYQNVAPGNWYFFSVETHKNVIIVADSGCGNATLYSC